jgi:hypothetical protein
VSFGIYFSGDVPCDPVPDPLAADSCRDAELLFVRIKIIRKIIPLLREKFCTDGFYV